MTLLKAKRIVDRFKIGTLLLDAEDGRLLYLYNMWDDNGRKVFWCLNDETNGIPGYKFLEWDDYDLEHWLETEEFIYIGG